MSTNDSSQEMVPSLLPFKGKHGLIQRAPFNGENKRQALPTDTDSEEKAADAAPSPPPQLSVVDLFARRQLKLMEKKSLIAELSSKIMENPEENIAMLKQLCLLCEEKDVDVRITTRKFAIISMLEVIKDIAPGYPLRSLSEKEKEVKVSKEVRKLRDFEEGVLTSYQRYLQILEASAQGKGVQKFIQVNGSSQKDPLEGLQLIAVQCQCDLLISLQHFNYHNNLIAVMVPRMDDDSHNGQISAMCCDAFHKLFQGDVSGNVSLEAVKMITKYVKVKGHRVKPAVLQVLLSLRINEMDVLSLRDDNNNLRQAKVKGQNKREKMAKGTLSKRDRKRQKEMKKLEKELQETEAVESGDKRARTHSELLKFVFLTYFRVLKSNSHAPLLSPALEGLAKYAHLINIDFFADLMTALNNIVVHKDLPLRETLNCVLTAFKILSGQGEALNIDPRSFYCTLYHNLLLLHSGASNDDVEIALKCLDVMLHKRRKQVPLQRVSAFIKRLSTVALNVMPNSSLALLAFVRSFLQLFPRTQALLESETLGKGVFRPEIEDPEVSNTESTACWELPYLASQHYHPAVRSHACHVMTEASGPGAKFARTRPDEFYRKYDSSTLVLNPDLDKATVMGKAPSKLRYTAVLDDISLTSIPLLADSITKTLVKEKDKVVRFTLPFTSRQ
ncbi:nucleolar complex protein 3 homolog isoform X2 [Nematostella vectensis]|nr:nucleolar complex protein 3 homolog isoform X2 [Nematostella vectensis]XP_048589736.1 nucleolar complex protein 3 homolog isoform X2 [Nematostella vectensis]